MVMHSWCIAGVCKHIIFNHHHRSKRKRAWQKTTGPVLIPAILSHAKPVCRNQQADMMLIAKSDPIDSGKGCTHTHVAYDCQ